MHLMLRTAALPGLALALAALVAPAARGWAASEEMQVAMSGGTRSAILVPARHRRAPTVIVLHGALVSAEHTQAWYGFDRLAARYGFAVVYPRGERLLWNDGRPAVLGSRADDVGFLRRLAADLVTGGTSDPARLYLVGVSNGGMLALRMLCEAPGLYAGIGTIIASMPETVGAACRARRPTSVVMLNGTADPLIPYRGGKVGFSSWQGRVWSAEGTAAFLARHNGCGAATTAVVARGGDGASNGGAKAGARVRGTGRAAAGEGGVTRVARLDWTHCSSGRGVTLYRVKGGGHQVYGATNFLPMLLGPGTRLVSGPRVIMAAFVGRPN